MESKLKHIFLLILALACFPYVSAQVVATGHATAEVVEAISATSASNDLLQLKQSNNTNELDLGNFTLNGKSLSVCSVMIKSTQLTGENGSQVAFNANPNTTNETNVLNQNGQQTFNLKGTTSSDIFNQNENNYSGQYNVVFAYN